MSFVAHRATLLSLVDWEPPDEAHSPDQKPSTSPIVTPVSVTNGGSPSLEDAALTPLPFSNGESASEEVTDKETRAIIPWATWGNKATQWFPTDHILTNWITTSCGTRLVLTEELESETGSNLTVYDFNWNRVKKALKAAQYLRDEEYESEAWGCSVNPLTEDEESFVGSNTQSVIPGAWITPDMAEDTPEQHSSPVASVSAEEIKGYPLGDWVFEEWSMDGDDCVLGRSENEQRSGDIRLINGDIPLPHSTNRFFKEQVVGGLPFIAVKRVVEETYQSVLMEEECLIGLKVSRLSTRTRMLPNFSQATNDDGINSIDILHVG